MDVDSRRSPGSTIAASEIDEHMTAPSSPSRPDPRTSLQHVLGDTHSGHNTPRRNGHHDDVTEDDVEASASKPGPKPKGSAAKGRGKGGGAKAADNPSIYAGNKIKHLKKVDGEPLWRKDIGYEFLKAIFDDKNKVFTNSYEPETLGKQTFSDLYIDTMARSSKTSKILRDKLLSDNEPAKNMAMVCLLVNVGRMNTTLNFFPEMRAQLRTYHAIPALQAHQDPNSYKQLQDAPRLKSILKGASEDRPEPNSLEKIKEASVPRTNPVNLIFVICQFAPKITDLHFPKPREFSDLIMRQTLSSKSRARAFLWLMWHYLESDFTQEGAEENPFGAGVDYGMDLANQGIPRFEYLSEKQAAEEDVDPQEEVDFGMVKQKERKRIIEADQAAFQAEYGSAPKRGPKPKLTLPAEDGASPVSILAGRTRPSKYESDIDSTRSTPPPKGGARAMGMHSVLASHNPKLRGSASLRHQILDNSSPAPGSSLNIIVNNFDGATRRSRPLTAHQLAVEQHRNQRVNYILGRGIRRKHHQSKKLRKTEGVLFRAMKRLNEMTDPFEDSEGEESLRKPPGRFRERGFGGLMPLADTEDDFGEELAAYAAAFRRTARRLERWDGNMGVVSSSGGRDAEARPHVTNGGQNGGADDTEDEKPADADVDADGGGDDDEDLDDMDKQLLGLASENEDQDEEELDDVEKEILGLRGDETEEEGSDGMEVDG